MSAHDFALRTRIVFGANSVDRLGELATGLGARRAFVVTDAGLVGAGHVERAESSLATAGIEHRRFDAVHENPTTADVDACLAALGDWDADLLIGFGGGSSLDVAKGCNFLRAGGGRMEDYWGVGKARGTMLPMIAVPTTAGTGSEMQSFALIANLDTHQKMACGDPQASARIAVLDPVLTVTQPRSVTACTGLDALAHAVETAVTTKRSPTSALFSTEAFRLIQAELPRVLEDPNDLVARGDMLLAAAYAGVAIENSMLGAAHSMANPLTKHHDIAHGQAVGMALPHIVRFNAEEPGTANTYGELARGAWLCAPDADDREAIDALIDRLNALVAAAGFSTSLADYGVPASAAATLADEATQQWTAQFNPREVSAGDFRQLFEAACLGS